MNKLQFLLLFGLLQCSALLAAETVSKSVQKPHSLEIGIADPIVSLAINNPCYDNAHGSVNYTSPVSTGHIFLQYNYEFLSWLSLGINADFMGLWKYQLSQQENPEKIRRINNYYVTVVPTLRFTYYQKSLVSLWSAVGIGFSESMVYDYAKEGIAQHPGAAFDLVALCVTIGKNHWFGTFQLGSLTTVSRDPSLEMEDKTIVYMLSDKIFRLSAGYRF